MIQMFRDNRGLILAIKISKIDQEFNMEENHFITVPGDPLQVGLIHRRIGHHFPAHQHLPVVRNITGCAEVLVVLEGALSVIMYDCINTEVDRFTLVEGDIFIQFLGGHDFVTLDEVRLLEVKQGPYSPDDKVYINPLAHEQSK